MLGMGECDTGEHPRYRGATTLKVFYFLTPYGVHWEHSTCDCRLPEGLDVYCAISMCTEILDKGDQAL